MTTAQPDGGESKASPDATLDWLLCASRQGLLRLDPLPMEWELRQMLGASRQVIRQTLGQLASNGLLDRRRSRGTSVKSPDLKLIGRPEYQAGDPTYRVLNAGRTPTNAVGRSLFGESVNTLLTVERLTVGAGGAPIGLSTFYLPGDNGIELAEVTTENIPISRLMHRIADGPTHSVYDLTAIAVDEAAARLLRVPIGSSVLHVQQIIRTDERVVGVVFARNPGLRLTFRADYSPE